MNLKKIILPIIIVFGLQLNAQTTATQVTPNPNDSRVITTGVPFLLIASDEELQVWVIWG